MDRVVKLLAALLFVSSAASAQTVIRPHIHHATDCPNGAPATSVKGTQCWEEDANQLYTCEPTAGACNTAAEWILVSTTLAGDVDGASGANDLDEAAVEAELESVLDKDDLQGNLTLAGDVDGAHGANDLDEAAVEAELESVLDFIGGTLTATDNLACRTDGTGGVTIQASDLVIADVAGSSLSVSTTAGNALALSATAPAAANGASQVGVAASLTASAAVASLDTAGAAAGGAVTITSGDAARLTSGNANGGDISLTTGSGIGTGVAGQVIVPNGTAASPGLRFARENDVGFFSPSANRIGIISNSTHIFQFELTTGSRLFGVNAAGPALENAASSATVPNVMFNRADIDTGLGGTADDLRLIAGGVSGLGTTATEVDIYLIRDDDTQSETCTDNANGGTAQALTITPAKSYIEITNADPQGCDITISETGAAVGRVTDLVVVSNAGGTVNFADTAGVTELAGAFNAAIDDYISLRYGTTTTWRERFRSNN